MNTNQKQSNKLNFEKLRKLAKEIKKFTEQERINYGNKENSQLYGSGAQR